MRFPPTIQALSATAALVLLAGCSTGSALAPKVPTAAQGHTHSLARGGTSVLSPMGIVRLSQHARSGYHGASFNSCPATGLQVYVSDIINGTVTIFAGHLAGQSPCGILTGFIEPEGLRVHDGTLYVANTFGNNPNIGGNILAFKRGATSPFRTYTDTTCSGQYPVDVAVSNDNVVIASNIPNAQGCEGSLSTFKKFTSTLIGNFPDPTNGPAYHVTVQKNSTVYFVDTDGGTGVTELWSGSCPHGVCGSFTNTGATINFPGGIRSDNGEDVVLDDPDGQEGSGIFAGTASEYAPPSFGSPVGVCLLGPNPPSGRSDATAIDINYSQHHLFYVDSENGKAYELNHYVGGGGSGCTPIGSVDFSSGIPVGIAVDRSASN